jgi:hypothetical protein
MVILVEEGCVEAEIGTESYILDVGDSIHFDSSIPHRWIAGSREARGFDGPGDDSISTSGRSRVAYRVRIRNGPR